MDLAKTLIRTVARGFYDTKHVLVIDAVLIHSALPHEDLSHVLAIQSKELRKLCGKLREDRLLAVHTRPETREGLTRPVNKEYYFIHFHATIDAIKYRVFKLTEQVKAMYKPTEEKKDYFCPQCGAKWSQLEVLDKATAFGFECHRCGGALEREESNADNSTGHEKQSRLMSQLEGLLKLLQQIDAEEIPNNDFEHAIAHAVPVTRDPNLNPTRATIPVNGSNGPPTAVRGLTQNALAPLDVSVTAGSEKSAAEQAAEAQRKANIAAQNALPVWHTTSTVTGQSTVAGQKSGEQAMNGGDLVKDEDEDNKDNTKMSEDLKAYYEQLAQEKEKEAREDQEADESSGEEDDEFEDVGISAEGTEGATGSLSPNTRDNQDNLSEGRKPRDSESGSSAPITNAPTPAGYNGVQDEDSAPPTKKVKFEQDGVEEEGKSGKDSDEDEDAEFEDAL